MSEELDRLVLLRGISRCCALCETITPVARGLCDGCGLDPYEAEEILAGIVKDELRRQEEDLDTSYWARREDILGG